MAQQEDGWPLGLQPLNARIGLVRSRNFSGSVSFSTLLTGSPTSTDSSSDLDTESTGSFFMDKSITLGSLIEVRTIPQLSRRSTRRRTTETLRDHKNNCKSKSWLFSLCSKLSTDAVNTNNNNNPPSLGHFLEAERRARRNHNSTTTTTTIYGPNDFSPGPELPDQIAAAPQLSSHEVNATRIEREEEHLEEHGNGYGVPLVFSCVCGQLVE